MKISVLSAVVGLASGLCAAQEIGRVISSTPVIQQVAVPRQVCTSESVPVPAQNSGAGAALGAIAGGAVGNAVGQGSGRAVATLIGIFGGAMLGDRVEGQNHAQAQNLQHCTTQTMFENRTSHYQVVYEYAGKQYVVQMPYDPGPVVKLQVTPIDAVPPFPPSAALTYQPPELIQPVYPQQIFVPVAPIRYPGYYISPYRPPIGFNLQFGYRGGHYRNHDNHGPWR